MSLLIIDALGSHSSIAGLCPLLKPSHLCVSHAVARTPNSVVSRRSRMLTSDEVLAAHIDRPVRQVEVLGGLDVLQLVTYNHPKLPFACLGTERTSHDTGSRRAA